MRPAGRDVITVRRSGIPNAVALNAIAKQVTGR
jgi:hypothetical protein